MATSTLPRRRGPSRRLLFAGALVVAAAAVIVYVVSGVGRGGGNVGPATVPVTRGPLVATVSGSGSVAPEQSLNLAFQTSGTVTEILVKEGDVVQSGQVLAKVDDRALQLQVASARSSLDGAKARLSQAQQGNARAEDIAAAQAAVTSAQANFEKVAKGPSDTDVAAAEAAIRGAQAAYDAAVTSAGTTNTQMEAAKATLAKAEANLRQAQGNYDKVAWLPNIEARPEALALQSATTDYRQAKANYDTLSQTSTTDGKSRVDSAAAQLAQAQANLAKLTPKPEDLTAAQASVDQARANVAKLTGAATASDRQIQQAAVSQSEQALKQAELALEYATLKAPFGGVIGQVNVVPGSLTSATGPAFRLINRSPLHVDLRLSENDVAKVQLGQPVKLTIQSLGDLSVNGKVSFIAPAAENVNGVVTYVVRVSFADSGSAVRVGMTADLTIEIARKDNVLLVPSTALLPKGAGRVVQVLDTAAARAQSGQPATREVDVRVGLSDGTNTEIVSGLSEGQQVVALPDTGVRRDAMGGFFGGQ
ncbi:MAG: efflux RND transporter periplasmic adaptor subunit [Chloroflexota bacterium]